VVLAHHYRQPGPSNRGAPGYGVEGRIRRPPNKESQMPPTSPPTARETAKQLASRTAAVAVELDRATAKVCSALARQAETIAISQAKLGQAEAEYRHAVGDAAQAVGPAVVAQLTGLSEAEVRRHMPDRKPGRPAQSPPEPIATAGAAYG